MLTSCSSAGSEEAAVAVMLMHRDAIGATREPRNLGTRCARHVKGEAAGRSIAVPIDLERWWSCGCCKLELELQLEDSSAHDVMFRVGLKSCEVRAANGANRWRA